MTRRRGAVLAGVAAVVVVVLVAGLLLALRRPSSEETAALTPLASPPPGSVLAVPARRHVWLVVFENHDDNAVYGRADAPFFHELAAQGASTEEYQAIAHPSQPNYLALMSGSTQGILDNEVHTFDAPSLFDQIDAAGKTWRVAAENVPDGCFDGATASGGRDGAGTYARKHEPAVSFQSIAADPARCARIGDLTGFAAGAADFQLIIPNLCHDMHDCPVADGDAWLRTFAPRIMADPAFGDGGLLLVTFDEGAHGDDDNDVATIALGPGVRPAFVSNVPHTHYSLLRTIQQALGLPCLAASCDANTLGEVFEPQAGVPTE